MTPAVFDVDGPLLIGMVHVPPLPGSPCFSGSFDEVRRQTLRDAEALVTGGIDHLMIENFGDTPFLPGPVPAHTVAHLTAITADIGREFPEATFGLNVLRNDGASAVGIAHATGGAFIRVNVLCGARLTDQGLVPGIAHDLLRLRRTLEADDIAILADVDVKHSAALAERPLVEEIDDVIRRGHADAVIVSGTATGSPVDEDRLQEAVGAADGHPVLVGSGANAESILRLRKLASGFIVGTSVKRDGDVSQPVDVSRVRDVVQACTGSDAAPPP